MPLKLIRQDITKITCDAIVNAANRSLLGGGGVDGAIHRAAGKRLLKACEKLGGCETGDAKLTKGYDLPCRYVIHTVGPVWHGGTSGERELLISCYRKSLALAVRKRCKSIAFPLISAGAYGYPKDEALQVATDTITAFLAERKQDLLVYLVIFNSTAYTISKERFADIEAFISDQYVAEAEQQSRLRNIEQEWYQEEKLFPSASVNYSTAMPLPENEKKKPKLSGRRRDKQKAVQPYEEYSIGSSLDVNDELSAMLNQIDESFSQMLMRKIDESGMTDAACYKKANIDRKLFSKIRSDIHYRPKKVTALAFAIALELNLEETKELLMKAGYALSHSSKFDLIVEYFITKGIYNVFTINEALFAFDQVLIGA